MAFTFKKEPRETGLASIAHPYPATAIKMDRKRVGTINPPFAHNLGGEDVWRVSFMVCDPNSVGGFNWIKLKATFEKEPDAREWLNKHFDAITARYQLHKNDY